MQDDIDEMADKSTKNFLKWLAIFVAIGIVFYFTIGLIIYWITKILS